MTIKKKYDINDVVWIYGIERDGRLTEGTVVHKFTLKNETETQYVISVPCEIDSLYEVRDWSTISQDCNGPVGAIRRNTKNIDITSEKLFKAGLKLSFVPETEVTVEETKEVVKPKTKWRRRKK